MMGVPLVVVWVTSHVLYLSLPMVTALVLSLALSFVCAFIFSRIWERRSRTAEISFSELMIWSWFRLQRAERRLEKGISAAEDAGSHEEQLQVLHELTAALESKDPYTRGHSKRVERHSFKTGVAMGLALADVEILRMSASLHDVGKIRVPNRVLHKTGPLTDDERALIEEHPVLGAEMVASMGDERVVETVRHHHERWDGRGYPDGKAGTEIPLFSRVIAVADSYDAIRSTRSYRTGASRDEAVRILTAESGHQFDADVVDAFLTTLPARGRVVAWVMSLAAWPGALWRLLEQLLQRFGSTALAPAIGAAGTAIVLGTTSLLTPAIPASGYAVNAILNPMPSPSSASANPSGGADRERVAAQARAERRQAAEARAERRRAAQRRERKAASTRAGSGSGSGSSTSPTSSTQNDSSTTNPTASDTSGGDQGTDGDPNAAGKDCKDRDRSSRGSRLHCS